MRVKGKGLIASYTANSKLQHQSVRSADKSACGAEPACLNMYM